MDVLLYLVLSAAIVGLMVSILKWIADERGRARLRRAFDDITSDIREPHDGMS